MNKPKILIYEKGTKRIYRTAGYRRPEYDELYITKSGKISRSQGGITDGDRLIVRLYNPTEDFKDTKNAKDQTHS